MAFPYRTGEEQQTSVRMLGKGDASLALQLQCVAMPGWNSHPAFGIEIERRSALKHPEFLFSYALRFVFCDFLNPQINTFSHCRPL
jgi:hypothetical protein